MFVRRLLVTGVVCGSLLLWVAHVAYARTEFFSVDDVATTKHDTAVDIDVTANDHLGGHVGGGVDSIDHIDRKSVV